MSTTVIPDGGTDVLAQLVGDTGISGIPWVSRVWWRYLAQDVRYFRQGGGPPCRAALHSGEGSYRSIYRIPSERAGCRSRIIEADYLLTNVDVNRQVEFVEQHVGLPGHDP